jgi:hypothetical protein
LGGEPRDLKRFRGDDPRPGSDSSNHAHSHSTPCTTPDNRTFLNITYPLPDRRLAPKHSRKLVKLLKVPATYAKRQLPKGAFAGARQGLLLVGRLHPLTSRLWKI